MRRNLSYLVFFGSLLACSPQSGRHSSLKETSSTGLCKEGSASCLVYKQTSDETVAGQYWVQGDHVYQLLDCGSNADALNFTGEGEAILQAESSINTTDVLNNPFLSCPKNGRPTQLDNRFNENDPIYRIQGSNAYLIPFKASEESTLYFQLDIDSCSKIFESWHVGVDRAIEYLDESPEGIRAFSCKGSGRPKPPVKPLERDRLGWHIYAVDNVTDFTSGDFGDGLRIYWLEYTWPDRSRAPLMIGQIKTSGLSLPIKAASDEIGQEVLEGVLSELFKTPVERTFDFGEIQDEVFLGLAADFRNVPVVALDIERKTLEPYNLQGYPGALVTSASVTTSKLPELIKGMSAAPLSGSQLVWQNLTFADGTTARAVQAKITDENPVRIDDTAPVPTPLTTKVQFVFESCSAAANLENILQPLVQQPVPPIKLVPGANRHNVRKLYKSLRTTGKPDLLIKYPCLARPRCELEVSSGEQLRSLALSAESLAACNATTEDLQIKLKNDLEIKNGSSNRYAVEIRGELWKQRLPQLKNLSITADAPVSLLYSCTECGLNTGTGCAQNGQTAIPVLDISGFESVRLKGFDLRLGGPQGTVFPFAMAGVKVRGGRLVLDHVNISKIPNRGTANNYQSFRTAMCSSLAQVYAEQSTLEAAETGAYLYRSQGFWNGSSMGKTNPNLTSFVDRFEVFPDKVGQTEANLSVVRAESATGAAIAALDSPVVGIYTEVQTGNYGLQLEGNSSLNGYGMDLFGPMTKRPDLVYDASLAPGTSRGLMLSGRATDSSELLFGRIIGFKYAVFLPRVERPEAGVNKVLFTDSLANPRKQNTSLSNYLANFSNGELICSGNCNE